MNGRTLAGLAAVLLLLSACSSGDGNEDLLNRFPRLAVFSGTPTTILPGGQVELRQVGAGQGRLQLEVWARGVSDLWAVAFTLEYDPRILRFRSAEPLDFLGTGTEVELVAEEPPGRTDQVMVGMTRLASPPAPSVGVTGSGAMLRLEFTLVGVGSTTMRFVPNLGALDPTGASIFPDDTHFIGGIVTTQ